MSTRGQVFIDGVYLYQHHDSYDIAKTVVAAVTSNAGKSRANDPEYLARIIFCEMVKNDVAGETGFGIGTSQHGDIEYLVTVNCDDQTITEMNVYGEKILNVWGFDGILKN